MVNKKSIITLVLSLIIYFVLDYGLNNAMLYILGGIIGGSIGEAFDFVGVNAGIVLICSVWTGLLIGLIVLFYRLNNNGLKYVLAFLVALFLYVIDMGFASIPYSDGSNLQSTVSTSIIVFLVVSKSLILTWLVYNGLIKGKSNRPLVNLANDR